MNCEIPKLEQKLAEMHLERQSLKLSCRADTGALARSITLAEHICECEKMLSFARANDNLTAPNNQQPTNKTKHHE